MFVVAFATSLAFEYKEPIKYDQNKMKRHQAKLIRKPKVDGFSKLGMQ